MTTHPGPPGVEPALHQRRTRRVTRWLLALLLVLTLAWLLQSALDPINVDLVIDGGPVFLGTQSSVIERFAAVATCAVVAFVVLLGIGLMLPVLLVGLVVGLLAVVAVVVLSVLGVPLLAIAVVALLLSPFLLLGWLLWKLLA
jgi:hypothetical protein